MSLYRLCVADVMSFDPIVVRADAPIEDAEELLEPTDVGLSRLARMASADGRLTVRRKE